MHTKPYTFLLAEVRHVSLPSDTKKGSTITISKSVKHGACSNRSGGKSAILCTLVRVVSGFFAVGHFAVGQFAVRKNVSFG